MICCARRIAVLQIGEMALAARYADARIAGSRPREDAPMGRA